jgi:hypothetical protein
MQESDRPTPGVVTIRVRNITLPVRGTRLPNGEFDIPFKMTHMRPQTPAEQREMLRREWYPTCPEGTDFFWR